MLTYLKFKHRMEELQKGSCIHPRVSN